MPTPRLAVRAIILIDGRLLLVNAYGPRVRSDLWCAPGGGVEPHASLPENLVREVHEETGLTVEVGKLALVNEFHAPEKTFHQVELFFHCHVTSGAIDDGWADPEAIVTKRRLFARDELNAIRFRPLSLPEVAFDVGLPVQYDPLETLVSP